MTDMTEKETTEKEIPEQTTSSNNVNADYDSVRKALGTNENVVVKCKCGDEIRRIPIVQIPTYDELLFIIQRLFKTKLSSNVDNYILRYTDEDGDLVSLTDDLDIQHAISQSKLLRVTVQDKTVNVIPSLLKNVVEELKLQIKSIQSSVDIILTSLDNEVLKSSEEKRLSTTKPLSTTDMQELLENKKDYQKSSSEISSVPLPSVITSTTPVSTVVTLQQPTSPVSEKQTPGSWNQRSTSPIPQQTEGSKGSTWNSAIQQSQIPSSSASLGYSSATTTNVSTSVSASAPAYPLRPVSLQPGYVHGISTSTQNNVTDRPQSMYSPVGYTPSVNTYSYGQNVSNPYTPSTAQSTYSYQTPNSNLTNNTTTYQQPGTYTQGNVYPGTQTQTTSQSPYNQTGIGYASPKPPEYSYTPPPPQQQQQQQQQPQQQQQVPQQVPQQQQQQYGTQAPSYRY